MKYAHDAGHMIGSHTFTLSTAQIHDVMFRMEEAFSRILGIKPAFMCPPFDDVNSKSIAAARGQSLARWDWDTDDGDGNTTAESEVVYNDVANCQTATEKDNYDEFYTKTIQDDGTLVEKRVGREFLDLIGLENKEFRYVL